MLPVQKTKPKQNLSDYTILIYGPSKIGKTTFCAGVDGALFLATEPGLNAQEVFQVPISNHAEALTAAAEIAKGGHQFKAVIIDTVDNFYRNISDEICRKNNVTHESDLGYGKGWAMVNAEFQRVLTRLANLPYGLFLISHSQEVEIETRTGKRTRIVPSMPDKARKILTGFVDMIFYCDIETTKDASGATQYQRVLRTKPTNEYEAGDRTGRLPETIPLSYQSLVDAFNGANKPAAKAKKE